MQPLGEQLLADSEGRSVAALLIPCGELALLPLHAAWERFADEEQARRLVLSYVPAARALAPRRSVAPDHAPGTTSFLGVGNAQPLDAPLHFAEQEIIACAAAAGVTEPPDLLGATATREKAIARLPEATLVHFACHGRFDPASPMGSAVYLANGEPLTLGELIDLELPRARLVVLSACETAISDTRFLPDEALGLANGFLHAGAQGVVSTLWPVNDVSTMLLMEQFYRCCFRDRLSPAAALQAARLWLRTVGAGDVRSRLAAMLKALHADHRSAAKVSEQYRRFAEMEPDARPFSHPYYWAGFTFSGT
jgi:CHAT domain-containing protein